MFKFASAEYLAIMLRMARAPKPLREKKYLRKILLGDREAVVDLRLLTTTTSQGI